MWLESETAQRMHQLYPPGGPPWFHTGHQPYIQAVTTTLIARGIEVSAVRLPAPQVTHENGIRAAEIELAPSAWTPQFPASQVPFTLHWNDAFGWNYVIDNPNNSGMSFGPGDDTILRSRGLGPNVSLVADPHHVADAVSDLLSGKEFEPAGWTGRDPDVQDVTLEAALAIYRQHPGALALDGRPDRDVISRDVLLHLDPGLLADLAQRRDGSAAAELDMRAAQVRVTATRYEINPLPEGAVSPRHADHYRVLVEPADASDSQWVVLAGQSDVPIYLTADGQETYQRQTYDLDTAIRTAKYAAVQRREGIFAMTADQMAASRPATAAAQPQRGAAPSALSAAAAWSQPVRQSLIGHAARQSGNPVALRPPSTGRDRTEHSHSAER